MTVTRVEKDSVAMTMAITAEFAAPIDAVWKMWEDPGRLERWWGPPTYPATVVDHELTVGGRVTYFMTGPEGDRHHGWWQIGLVDPPRRLEFEDGFGDDSGEPDPTMPVSSTRVMLAERHDGGTVMKVETFFPSVEVMEQMLAMGMEEGMKLAMGQIDDLLVSTA